MCTLAYQKKLLPPMSMPPQLSIVIPTRVSPPYLLPLINSIVTVLWGQGILYELVISLDRPHFLPKQWQFLPSLDLPVHILIPNKRQSYTKAVQTGIQACKGETIIVLNPAFPLFPEVIPIAFKEIINKSADTIIICRQPMYNTMQRFYSALHCYFFGQFSSVRFCGCQTSIIAFPKNLLKRIPHVLEKSNFALHAITYARQAGYTITTTAPTGTSIQTPEMGKRSWGQFCSTTWSHFKEATKDPAIIPITEDGPEKDGYGFHHNGQKFVPFTQLHHHHSAFERVSAYQGVVFILLIFLVIFGAIVNWHATITVLVALITISYFADLLFNLFLIYRSFSKVREVKISQEEIALYRDYSWPTYTIFCPLYKEWEVLPQFVTAMSKLNYPKDKLQVMLLLEEDDEETIRHVRQYNLPAYFDIVIVPHVLPKTKPKALNYGLQHALGEYLVVYDAEDIPDPQQLKKAIIAFNKVDPRTICIQAKLNFYNPHQNILTRVFTAEYSLWFDLVLTGLQSVRAPIPLGGTSNHFHITSIRKLKGWDPFNVTEDCDLGMRLVKNGFRTAVVDSVTLEEANSNLKNWFGQRSRWVKGYIQTYLVHTRNLKAFMRDWREPHLITFQMVVGGKIMALFVNPLMWLLTIVYFVFRAQYGVLIESFFPSPVFYMALVSLLFGNFLYLYYYMLGAAKREQYELIKYAFLVPFYWLAMSAAAWIAVYKIITKPHHWQKTQHGLHLHKAKVMDNVKHTIGSDLVDHDITQGDKRPVIPSVQQL